jgi:hypothetical protein
LHNALTLQERGKLLDHAIGCKGRSDFTYCVKDGDIAVRLKRRQRAQLEELSAERVANGLSPLDVEAELAGKRPTIPLPSKGSEQQPAHQAGTEQF